MRVSDVFSRNGEMEKEKGFIYPGELIRILKGLGNGSQKFAIVLEETCSSLSVLLDHIKRSKEIYRDNRSNDLEYENEYSEYVKKWEKIVETLKDISIKLEIFSENILNKRVPEIKTCTKPVEEREKIPTHIGRTRMTPDEFMQVLRYFPVKDTEHGMNESKLRKNLIYAHSEFSCAKKFLDELEKLNVEYEISELIAKADNRIRTTQKLLATAIEELANSHDVYKVFLTEYMVALGSPVTEEHKTSEYKQKFHSLILSKTEITKIDGKLLADKNKEYDNLKSCTTILNYIADDFSEVLSNCL